MSKAEQLYKLSHPYPKPSVPAKELIYLCLPYWEVHGQLIGNSRSAQGQLKASSLSAHGQIMVSSRLRIAQPKTVCIASNLLKNLTNMI
jgi:hypothetical protein